MNESGPNGAGASGGGEEESMGGAGEERTWRVRTERLRVTGGDLLGKLRQLVHEGNVRRIIIRGGDERILVDIPVTAGVVGVVLAPFAVAVGAVAALAARCTVEIERLEEQGVPAAETEAAGAAAEAGTTTGEADATGAQADAAAGGVEEETKD